VRHALSIDTTQEPPAPLVPLHGHGGVQTAWRVARTTAGTHGRATAQDVLEVLRERSTVCRALPSAATRNRLGARTGTGNPWRAQRVACVRSQYRLPHVSTEQDGLTRTPAAQPLGVRATLRRRLLRQGTLPAHQVVPFAPWILHRPARAVAAGHAAGQAGQTGRPRPGRGPGPPECPVPSANEAGDVEVPAARMDPGSAHLVGGETGWPPDAGRASRSVSCTGWRQRRSGAGGWDQGGTKRSSALVPVPQAISATAGVWWSTKGWSSWAVRRAAQRHPSP